jgi:hypothetical protein
MPELNTRRVSETMTERISRDATSRREKRVGRPHQERVSDRPDPPATISKPVKKGGVDRPGSSRVERPKSSRRTADVIVDFPKTPRKNSLSLSSSTLDLQSMCTTETISEHRQSMKQKPTTSTTNRLQKRNSGGPLDVSWAETSIVWGDEEATIDEEVTVDEEDYMIESSYHSNNASSRRKSTVTEAMTESMTNLNDSIMSILSIRKLDRRSVVHPQVDNELAEAEKEFALAAAKAEAAAAELKRKEEKIRLLRAEAKRNSIRV